MTTINRANDTELANTLNDYSESAIQHGDATESGDSDAANIAFDRIMTILNQFFLGDRRNELASLLGHENPSVRAFAALHTYRLDAVRSESILEEVAKSPGLVGFSAEMTLREIRNGRLSIP